MEHWPYNTAVYIYINRLTANAELSRHENLTFLCTWTLRWVPRSFATHASLCNTLSSNKLCPKTVKILAVKGLRTTIIEKNYETNLKFPPFPPISMLLRHIEIGEKGENRGYIYIYWIIVLHLFPLVLSQ